MTSILVVEDVGCSTDCSCSEDDSFDASVLVVPTRLCLCPSSVMYRPRVRGALSSSRWVCGVWFGGVWWVWVVVVFLVGWVWVVWSGVVGGIGLVVCWCGCCCVGGGVVVVGGVGCGGWWWLCWFGWVGGGVGVCVGGWGVGWVVLVVCVCWVVVCVCFVVGGWVGNEGIVVGREECFGGWVVVWGGG
uniref:Uncharacterized protein n=1 Tax=Knipowitschia caucasica TaxID=637954 RepID=A0AAV2JN46_KNICA